MSDLHTVGLGLPWEELNVGRAFKTVGRTITETDLVNFVGVSGMFEELFTNVEVSREEGAIQGGRLVPAALVYAVAEGLLIQGSLQGVGFAFLGMELDVKGPVFVGDTLHVRCEVTESRPSKGRPGLGLVRTRNQVVKQDGSIALVYTPLRLLKGRAAHGR